MKAILIVNKSNAIEPLSRVCGLTLLERCLYTLKKAGIRDFFIVCGSQLDNIRSDADRKKLNPIFNANLIREISDIPIIDDTFLLLEVNVIFDVDVITKIKEKINQRSIIFLDSAKYVSELNLKTDHKVIFFDKNSLSDFGFWNTINTLDDIKHAENLLLNRNLTHFEEEGLIGNFVRKIPAKILTKYLMKTPITPNQITSFSFLSFCISAFLLSFGNENYDKISGLFILFAIILDYTDGIIARLKFKTSKFGAWFDDMSDLIGFYLIIFGATVGLYIRTNSIFPWILGTSIFFWRIIISKDESLSNISTDKDITKIQIYKKETIFNKIYINRKLYSSWASKLLLLAIGAFFNIMPVIFLIFIIYQSVPWIIKKFIIYSKNNRVKE